MKRTLLIFLLFLISQFVGAGLALVFGQDPVTMGLCIGAAEVLLIVALIAFGLTTTKRPVTDSFRRGMPVRWWKALIGFMVISFGLNLLMTPLDLPDFGMEAQFDAMRGNWLCLFTLIVIAPLAEELVFRDGILRSMMAGGANKWIAIITSAVAFGVVHGDPAQMIPAIVMGIVLGWFYVTTGDLRLCLPAHILNNALAIVLMAYPEIEESFAELHPARCIFYGISLILLGYDILENFSKRQTQQ